MRHSAREKRKNTKRSIAALIKDELQLLFYDKWLLFAVTLLPAGLFAVMFAIFQQGIVRELPIAVVDNDNSRFSRMLTRSYDASSHLQVQKFAELKEAAAALRGGKVYGIIVLPNEMEKKIRLGQSPKVTAFYNFQFILIGKVLKSSVATAHATFNTRLAAVFGLGKGNVQIEQAKGRAIVTYKQISPLYNFGLNYGQFLVTALIPTIWQIVMVAVIILVWAAEERRSGLINWLSEQSFAKVSIRLSLYQCIFLLQGVCFAALFIKNGWAVRGSLPLLCLAQWLTVLACLGIGSLVFINIPDAARALSLATSYTAPSFAFLGVTFPASDMNTFASLWHSLLPVSYYMKIQIGLANHGASFAALLPHFQKLSCFLLLFLLLSLSIYKKREKAGRKKTL